MSYLFKSSSSSSFFLGIFSILASSIDEGRYRFHVGENIRRYRLHASPETQIVVRVFQIFHSEQYVNYSRLSFQQLPKILCNESNSFAWFETWHLNDLYQLGIIQNLLFLLVEVCCMKFVKVGLVHLLMRIFERWDRFDGPMRLKICNSTLITLQHLCVISEFIRAATFKRCYNNDNNRPEVDTVGCRTALHQWF